jgi:3-hydroxyacyl-CoA dehydrogenase
LSNLRESLPHDEERDVFQSPPVLRTLVSSGRLGEKSGAGFYQKRKTAQGTEILALDVGTGAYRPQEKVRFDSLGKARKADRLEDKLKAVVNGTDAAAQLAWRVTADTLVYAAHRIPEIADDVVNVDRALRWGFGWDLGPFETWDALGVRATTERMLAEGRDVPAWVRAMLEAGRESFYTRTEDGTLTHWQHGGGARPVERPTGELHLVDLRARGREIERTASASLFDLGDGVLGFEIHTKLNALDDLALQLYAKAVDHLDEGAFEALVVGNQDPQAFSAGANVLMILMGAVQGEWTRMEQQLASLQQLHMRTKYHPKPIVTAPHDLTLGGGAELTMHAAATVAAGELYMGLVEVGVGLIPGAGGCKELLVRALGDVPQDVDYDPNPFVQKVFERIGLAKVSTSAEEARSWGYLRPTDRVVTNPDRLIAEARRSAIGLVAGGYVPPRPRTVKVPGATGRAAIELYLYQMRGGGFATDHDLTVGRKLAWVLTGGDVPWGTSRSEQDLLDLERETFLSLAGTKESQARMQHMLEKGKPLRN